MTASRCQVAEVEQGGGRKTSRFRRLGITSGIGKGPLAGGLVCGLQRRVYQDQSSAVHSHRIPLRDARNGLMHWFPIQTDYRPFAAPSTHWCRNRPSGPTSPSSLPCRTPTRRPSSRLAWHDAKHATCRQRLQGPNRTRDEFPQPAWPPDNTRNSHGAQAASPAARPKGTRPFRQVRGGRMSAPMPAATLAAEAFIDALTIRGWMRSPRPRLLSRAMRPFRRAAAGG